MIRALPLFLLLLGAAPAAAQDALVDAERARLAIGIAPFEEVAPPGRGVPALADGLAARILARGVGRTVSPASLADHGDAEPGAERVRLLSREHELDALVVGRVTRLGDRVSIDLRLRDGSSGAVAGTYVAELPLAEAPDAVLDRLADQLVAGALALPHVTSAPSDAAVAAAPVPAPAGASVDAPARARAAPRPGIDALAGDEPFSIRSDELEVNESEGARRLIFRGGVEARRGDLVLQASRLEASYPAGAKEPSALSARGAVRVAQGDREARCVRADYRRSEQTIVCRGDALLRDGADTLRGDAIVFDLAKRRVRVEGGTEVALTPRGDASGAGRDDGAGMLGALPTDGPVRITASQLEAIEREDGRRRLRFEGSVEVAQEDLVLRARQIDALYAPRSQEPEQLVARGDVVVIQQGREARCDEAVYRRAERRVDCTGGASLRDGEDVVTGRAIAFDLAAEKLVVTGETRLVLAPRPPKETATP